MSFTRRLLMAGSAFCLASPALPRRPSQQADHHDRPFAAGGPTDVIARIVGEHMSRTLGQTIVVENVAGAGGTTGITRAAKSTPDGYTIAMGHMGTHGAAAGLYPNLGYNPQTDFEPIGLAAGTPIVIVAKKDFPANNLQEFVKHVQANQKTLNAAHAGVALCRTSPACSLHFMLKVEVNEIPYRGTGPAINDLVAGKVDYVCDQIVSVSEQVKGGTIKAFGIATSSRSPSLPDVPTTIEGGLPAFQVSAWNAIFAPKGTPPGLSPSCVKRSWKAVTDPATKKKKLEDLGGVVPDERRASPEALAELVRRKMPAG